LIHGISRDCKRSASGQPTGACTGAEALQGRCRGGVLFREGVETEAVSLLAHRFDAAAFAALTADPAVKQGLVANTEEAVARGVFGAPTMFVGDEMHFGQDRLDFVAQALAR
jgi:hypothetical protein